VSALALAKGNEVEEVEEVEDPPVSLIDGDTEGRPREIDLSDRFWKDGDEWVTDFPPPPCFEGWERGQWGDIKYERACSPEETELLEATENEGINEERAEEEALRDAWFRMLKRELNASVDSEDMTPDAEEQEYEQDVVDDQELPDADHPASPAFVGGVAADHALQDPDQGRDHQHEIDGEAPQDAGMVGAAHGPIGVDGISHGPDGQDQAKDEKQSVGVVGAHRRLSPRDHRASATLQHSRAEQS
jgi:hypothetical protein